MSLPYDLESLPREKKKFYISATKKEISEMLSVVGCDSLDHLYDHIPKEVKFDKELDLPMALEYSELKNHLESIAAKNKNYLHFAAHGLPVYKIPAMLENINLRRLATSYTPYQPERSQGTLITQWIYQCCLAQITGFEAINSSLYDRSTAIYEGICCAHRIQNKKNTALVFDSLYDKDKTVLLTMAKHTEINIKFIPAIEEKTGRISLNDFSKFLEEWEKDAFCVVYPHVNTAGVIEEVNAITDLIHQKELLAIAVIDPMLLGEGGLKPPSDFGKKGADIFVGEGQHLALPPNFGGPGLGLFGIRFNEQNKSHIRSTAGRFVGHAVDQAGRPCKVIVLSTREQHIRREKANSNICSNQAFLATLAGVAMLTRGDAGLKKTAATGYKLLRKALSRLLTLEGIELAFSEGEVFNQVTLKLHRDTTKPLDNKKTSAYKELLTKAEKKKLILGVDISTELKKIGHHGNYLSLSFSDIHSEKDIDTLCDWFESEFKKKNENDFPQKSHSMDISASKLRQSPVALPVLSEQELLSYYKNLTEQNVSPDDACYPLGSCTMKYNPYINDYAAGLPGFIYSHPEHPTSLIQGNLEIIYKTQEYFKIITGLDAVTTQPVAGAQGELVGLKLFQAYHEQKGKGKLKEFRDIVLIPYSAHGTNPATATVAGFITRQKSDRESGIISIKAGENGEIDLDDLKEKVQQYSRRIAGIMVTNPNTSGIFEKQFKTIADLIHSVDGLVYMDGANMNAIAGWVDLGKLGVDAVHNNTHKTWSIPHGGGGPGDAFVAVSAKLKDFLPGVQVVKKNDSYDYEIPPESIGSVHRHFGNFAHKVRCYTYLRALGKEGVKKMSAIAVLSARYLYQRLKKHYVILPFETEHNPRMHEFIISLSNEAFENIQKIGLPKVQIISRIGKLFLDFGFHSPTVAFPEVYGLMIEPTESYSKKELDKFADSVIAIKSLIDEHPEVLLTVPHFTPIDRVNEVEANKNLLLSEKIIVLPEVLKNRISQKELLEMDVGLLKEKIVAAHQKKLEKKIN